MALGVDEGPGERVLARDIQLWFIPRLCHISMTLDQFFNFFKSQFPRLQSGSDKNHLEALPRSLSKLTRFKHTS